MNFEVLIQILTSNIQETKNIHHSEFPSFGVYAAKTFNVCNYLLSATAEFRIEGKRGSWGGVRHYATVVPKARGYCGSTGRLPFVISNGRGVSGRGPPAVNAVSNQCI